MKKIIAILMLAVMVLTAVACGTPSGPAQSTDPVTTAPDAVTTDAPVTEPPKFVHSGNTYDQADFIILLSSLAGDTFNDFKYNETEPTVLDNAVQQKNMACEEMFDIVIDYVEDFSASTGGFSKMRQEKTAGTVGYHLSFMPGQQVSNMAYTGLLYDLNHISTLDMKNEWWDQNANKELSVCVLRYFNPVGAHESGLIGEDPKGIPNNLMPYVAQVASGKLACINVFGDDYNTPDGTGVRDYIHVVDLALGHIAAIEHCNDTGVRIYNLGTGHGYSVFDMIHAFEKACGKTLPYKVCPRRSGDIASCYAAPDKAKKELQWEAMFGIEEMCASQWKWQSGNPRGYEA